MLAIILGIGLLVWPLATIPTLQKNKSRTGYYFSKDPRVLITKDGNMGNNLNMNNKIAFTVEVIASVTLIVYGVFLVIH